MEQWHKEKADKCPYCGSKDITLTDSHTLEKFSDKVVSAGIAHLLGLSHHGSIGGNDYDKPYVCNKCHKTWVGNGYNPDNIPETELILSLLQSDINNNIYSFDSYEKVREFFWEIDVYLYSLSTSLKHHEYFHYNPLDWDEEKSAKLHLLRAYACICLCLSLASKNECVHIISLYSICLSGLYEVDMATQKHKTNENVLCENILKYLLSRLSGDDSYFDLSLGNLPNDLVLTKKRWNEIVCDVIKFRVCNPIEPNSTEEVIEYFLTKDLRLSSWMMISYKDIGHVGIIDELPNRRYEWEQLLLPKIHNNFCIPKNEKIVFIRDSSFWNNKNQGLVITTSNIYYLPDNDDGLVYIYPWEGIKEAAFLEDQFEFAFLMQNDEVFSFDKTLLTKGGLLDDVLRCIDDVINDILQLIN